MSETQQHSVPAAIIRLATAEDAPNIARIYAPFVQSKAVSFEVEPPDAEEMRTRIGTILRQHPWLVCEVAGEVCGYAYGSKHRERTAYQWAVDTTV